MRNKRNLKRKKIFIVNLVVCLAVMAGVFWFVLRNPNSEPVQPVEQPTTITAVEQEQTVPVVAAADWAPQERQVEQNAAVMTQFSAQEAEVLLERGFRSVVLPAVEYYDAEELMQAREILETLGEEGVFRTLTLTPVDNEEMPRLREVLAQFISDATFDAVLFTDSSEVDGTGRQMVSFTNFILDFLGQAELSLPIFFELDHFNGDAYRQAVQALAGELDYAELLVGLSYTEVDGFSDWALQAMEYVGITALLNLENCIPNGNMEETMRFLTALQGLEDFPLALRAADFVPEDNKAAELLSRFFSAGDLNIENFARNFALQRPVSQARAEQTITAQSPNVNFTGGSNPLFALMLNGEEVERDESGDFSFDQTLEPGRNTFAFEHRDQSYVVNVVHEVTLIQSVSPTGRMESTGGVEFMVSTVALRGSIVRASLAGDTITLQPGAAAGEDEEEREQADADFVTYVGTFRLPNSRREAFDVGTVRYTVSYRGLSATRNGALVVVLPEAPPPTEAPPTTTEQTTVSNTTGTGTTGGNTTAATTGNATTTTQTATARPPGRAMLTPATNHGLGTARMAEITADHANARSNAVMDNRSNPTLSPLLRGTFDYIIGQTTIQGNVHYLLASGKRINGSDLRVIENGFRLPLNRLHSSGRTENSMLTMRFDLDWRVPFNIDFIGQNYSSQFAEPGYAWGVRDFHATGLEITFYHTQSFSGSVDFAAFPLISNATWSQNAANNTVTLRLMFRNAGRFFGWQAVYEGNQLVIRLGRRPPATLSGAVIVLDPGHGGRDPGALFAPSHPTIRTEAQMVMLIANQVRDRLVAQGATVHMTRTGDTFVSLQDRAAFARRHNPDVFVSIHGDASPNAAPMGVTSFYFRPFSQPLAASLQNRLVRAWREQIYTPANGFANYRELHGRVDRGVRFFPYAVTRIEEAPAVLIEVGFVTNLTEGRALQNTQHQNAIAQAIANGIADYLRNAQ